MKPQVPAHPGITHVEDPGRSRGVDKRFSMCGLEFPRPTPGNYVGWWTVKGRQMHRLLSYEKLRPHRVSMSEMNVAPVEKVMCTECRGAYIEYRLTKGSFL